MSDVSVNINQEMVERLYVKTSQGDINWELNSDRNPVTSVASYRVMLNRTYLGNGAMENLTILSDHDEVIDSFTDEDLDADFNSPVGFESYYMLMEALREKAFRQAVGADKAIADIMKTLRR